MSTPFPSSNRLIGEKSLYLQQHASDPVDWYSWGPDAFAAAAETDKPIFLSIGYATCHWCHVMARESFQNPLIAALMNDAFINIKVDREELPAVDALYMDFAQVIMQGGGGWPLNLFLSPDLQPFFATTYIPAINSRELIGFADLIRQINGMWQNPKERALLIHQADQIVKLFESDGEKQLLSDDEVPESSEIEETIELMFEMADPLWGGLKGAPKFPIAHHVDLMLRYAKLKGESRALFFADLMLDRMQRGGIRDHLCGGFARYSVDEKWQIPHFEKMLCDNALLLGGYLQAWRYLQKPVYKEVAIQIGDWLIQEMRGPEGQFFSAIDAETEGKEGYFQTWTLKEIQQVIRDKKRADLFCAFYNVTEEGNFEGRSILYQTLSLSEFAQAKGLDEKSLEESLQGVRVQLQQARANRALPLKDDKAITAWNALTIQNLALAGFYLQNEEYTRCSIQCMQFIQSHLWQNGRLMRRFRQGEAGHLAILEDYAYLIQALLTLYELSAEDSWLIQAIDLADIVEKDFLAPGGDFFTSSENQSHLLIRRVEHYDSSEPSGNGVHAENLLKLYFTTKEKKYLTQAENILTAARPFLQSHGISCCYHIMALMRLYDKNGLSLQIAWNKEPQVLKEIQKVLQTTYQPHLVISWTEDSQKCIGGQTTLYPCFKGRCLSPVIASAEKLQDILQNRS